MDLLNWQLWMIAAVLLLIIEIFTPSFLAACLAIGCAAAGVFALMKYGINIQLLSFSVGTLIAFFAVRPIMLKYAHKKDEKVKTNVDALVGKTGRVTETIDNSKNTGRAMVEGDDWKAESENDVVIQSGSRIVVTKVNSTIITVKSTN